MKPICEKVVLVTGGAGFIGSSYIRMLLNGHLGEIPKKVYLLDSLTYAGSLENLTDCTINSTFEFIQGDIRDTILVNRALKDVELLVHFAAESHVDRSITNSSEFISTNVLGTHVLLDAAVRNNIETFLHVSTDEVYGSIAKGKWNEDEPLQPNSPYAASKASSDLLVRAFGKTHNLDVRISRCSNNYGPYQYPEKLIPLIITNLLSNKKIPIYGDGANIREWIHCDDHSRAIHRILLDGEPGHIYNIAGSTEISNLELARKLLKILNRNENEIVYVADRKGHDFRYCMDDTKIKTFLKFSPSISFESGLKDTVAWYLENEAWWKSRI